MLEFKAITSRGQDRKLCISMAWPKLQNSQKQLVSIVRLALLAQTEGFADIHIHSERLFNLYCWQGCAAWPQEKATCRSCAYAQLTTWDQNTACVFSKRCFIFFASRSPSF
jgi:hypothetical protein